MKQFDIITSQIDLFSAQDKKRGLVRNFDLKDSDITLYPNFIKKEDSLKLFKQLLKETDWRQQYMNFYGKRVAEPRLMALYGQSSKTYSYSGITMQEQALTQQLGELKETVENICQSEFTSILMNQYRDENDSVSWHSDSEPELGRQPVIASLSLGAGRRFMLKHKTDDHQQLNVFLESGSLLIMQGDTQHYWLHQVPKGKNKTSARINLTFRKIY